VVWAGFADHATGRHAAVTRNKIADRIGCDKRTVTSVWAVVLRARFAMEIARGHGSSHTLARAHLSPT
jgi:hypothetical protein